MHIAHLNSILWLAICILSRGLLPPHNSHLISLLLIVYLQHRNAHQIGFKVHDPPYHVLNDQTPPYPSGLISALLPYLRSSLGISFHLFCLRLSPWYTPSFLFSSLLSPQKPSPPSGNCSAHWEAMGGVCKPLHPTGLGQGSTRLFPLDTQSCQGVSVERRVGTK